VRIGIVGSGAEKFRTDQIEVVKTLIESLLSDPADSLVSGASPGGGIDDWAEQVADRLGRAKLIHAPKNQSWKDGYRRRNLRIARDSDIVHVIVPRDYPVDYMGKRDVTCYHCAGSEVPRHIRSGGCWTGRKAMLAGKDARWHVIP
jgi:hypothetical protein